MLYYLQSITVSMLNAKCGCEFGGKLFQLVIPVCDSLSPYILIID